MNRVAFIGLGVMGYPMAGHVRKRGTRDVVVFNRTKARAEAWVEEFGGRAAATPAEATREADFVFTCVGNDHDLREVTLGPGGAFSTLKPGAVFIDNTTASATIARELHAAAKSEGAGFLDAPVSGGQAGAANGTLTVMVGGDEEDFRKAKPTIGAYARAVTLIGPSGAGQLTKMVNQICIAGLIEGLAEALHFAKRANLDISKVIDTLSKGAAQSWQMENRAKNMCAGGTWWKVSSISVSPWTWRARTLRSFSTRLTPTASISRSRRLSTNSMPRSRPWAATVGIRRA